MVLPFGVVVSEHDPFPVEIVPPKFQTATIQEFPPQLADPSVSTRRKRNARPGFLKSEPCGGSRRVSAWRIRGP
jgi:hypothetical protein